MQKFNLIIRRIRWFRFGEALFYFFQNKCRCCFKYWINDKNKEKQYDIRKNLIDQKTLNLTNARIISDNFPLMEQLNQVAARQWREDYLKNITLKYRDQGVPLIR